MNTDSQPPHHQHAHPATESTQPRLIGRTGIIIISIITLLGLASIWSYASNPDLLDSISSDENSLTDKILGKNPGLSKEDLNKGGEVSLLLQNLPQQNQGSPSPSPNSSTNGQQEPNATTKSLDELFADNPLFDTQTQAQIDPNALKNNNNKKSQPQKKDDNRQAQEPKPQKSQNKRDRNPSTPNNQPQTPPTPAPLSPLQQALNALFGQPQPSAQNPSPNGTTPNTTLPNNNLTAPTPVNSPFDPYGVTTPDPYSPSYDTYNQGATSNPYSNPYSGQTQTGNGFNSGVPLTPTPATPFGKRSYQVPVTPTQTQTPSYGAQPGYGGVQSAPVTGSQPAPAPSPLPQPVQQGRSIGDGRINTFADP